MVAPESKCQKKPPPNITTCLMCGRYSGVCKTAELGRETMGVCWECRMEAIAEIGASFWGDVARAVVEGRMSRGMYEGLNDHWHNILRGPRGPRRAPPGTIPTRRPGRPKPPLVAEGMTMPGLVVGAMVLFPFAAAAVMGVLMLIDWM